MLEPINFFKEQRQSLRVSLYSPLRFQIKSSRKFGSTVSRDISLGGIRFLTDNFVPVGTSMILEVNLGDTPNIVNAIADVVWTQKLPHTDRYQMGLRFSEIGEPYHQEISDYINSRRG